MSKPMELSEIVKIIQPVLPFTIHLWQLEEAQAGIDYKTRYGMFLPVGSGKTLIATLVAWAWGDPTVIVTLPPILIAQWVKWINSLPHSGGAIGFQGTPAQRYKLPIEKYKFIVMSLDIFKRDYAALSDNYAGQDVTLLVDEAQSIKNTASENFKLVNSFSAGRKLILATGTELNNPGDAYAYIKLKTPMTYRSKAHFENLHVASRDFYDRPDGWLDLDTIKKNLYQLSSKKTKEEVHAHLPRANYVPLVYPLAPAHKKLYDKMADEMLLELPSGGKIDATVGSSLYNALQQIVVNWDKFAGEEGLRPAIFDVIDQMFDEIALGQKGSSKVIIWTWFVSTTEAILNYCNSKFKGAAVAAYSKTNSIKNVARFMEDPSCLILVAQPGSAGAGLNPQYFTWECMFAEAPTRTIPFTQAAGRIDREGQRYNPTIRVAQALGTVQMSMFQALLNNDAEVMKIQSGKDLRAAIYGQ